ALQPHHRAFRAEGIQGAVLPGVYRPAGRPAHLLAGRRANPGRARRAGRRHGDEAGGRAARRHAGKQRHPDLQIRSCRSGTLMRDVAIIGVGAHATGRFRDKKLKDLAYPAIWGALDDAGVTAKDINVAYVGNSLGGLLTGQEGIRGQVVLQHSGISGIPIINVENACASAMTALRGAWLEVASGAADVALAVGVEKMNV